MNKIGIDQSYTSTGIVIIDNQDNVICVLTIETAKDENIFERAYKIANKIAELIKQYNVSVVNIEGLSFKSFGNATRDLAGLQFTIITTIAFQEKLVDLQQINIINPQRVKRFATGDGKSKKIEMFLSLPEQVKETFANNGFAVKERSDGKLIKSKGTLDVTDAYWIATFPLKN